MYDDYGDRVAIYLVYIREAHAIDSSWAMPFAGSDGSLIQDPVSEGERSKVASQCAKDLDLPMPALIDKMDDAVNNAYLGWPDRLYLIGTDGKVAYSGGRGPFFFEVKEIVAAIEAELGASAKTGGDK